MLPLTLTLQGIYSYQDRPQTIDFTKLTQAEIFGIFGATGSGKSAILEAISYALYGRTERLSQADKMKYNMMNLRSKRMFIDFSFVSEDKTYRFTVQAKRNKKNFEDVSTPERLAYLEEEGEWTPISADSAEEILGLSYENFKRTIIIPQGKFEEFLQMTSTERTRMLKEIFHLGKYELWNRTASLEKKNQLSLNSLETLLLQLLEVNPEALETVQAQIAAADKALIAARKELKGVEQKAQQLEALQALFQQLKSQTAILEALRLREPEFQTREERLRRYESCLLHFQPLLERRRELNETLNRLTRTRTQKKASADELSVKLVKSEETFQQVKVQYLQREQLKLKAEELEKVVDLKELEGRRAAVSARMENGRSHVELSRQKITDLQSRRQELAAAIKKQQQELPDFQTLLDLKTWLTGKASLDKEEKRTAEGENEARARLEALDVKKIEVLRPTRLDPGQFALPVSQLLTILGQEHSRSETEALQAEQEIARLAARAQLRSLAEGLEDGDPCPLCGATHHPDIQDFAHMDQALAAASERKAELREALRALETARAGLSSLEETRAQRVAELERALAERQAARQALEQHDLTFVWEAYRDLEPAQLQAEVIRLERLAAGIRDKERDRDLLDQSLQKERENLDKYQKAVDLLKEDRDKLEVTFRAGVEGLKTLEYEAYKGWDNYRLEQQADQVRREYEGVQDLYESTEGLIKRQRSELDSLRGELEAIEEQYQDSTRALARQARLLNETLEKSEFETLEEVEQVLQTALNPATERSEINRFREELHSARQAMAELESRTQGKTFDPEALENLEAEIVVQQEQIAALTRQLGGFQQEMKRLEEQWKRKQELEKERTRLEHRAENLKLMKRMFNKSGFVNYVSTIYLHNLCVAANERFRKLTRGALSLETADGNQFLVRDFLHDGQARSVKTLSGGQTFQAALSLALALAEQVQQQAKSKQNFFFIDEGFGSQDKESLLSIFETLKALRREHRIVGVISHVEELQQEIDSYLHITNEPETGSKIRGSWM